ncbi:UDP-xylose and UDP-N-acetylglucosamine transporter [Achlya hypogyna]|uniref:UDP-xylose and UDP-N-acetylglucosamine transporter n=1 Tax=Achlya hypogyna TaxID=1202772 RepID=A0A1V9ZL23_ACHHY|nr:UDP-xylose and UDP-N-acetylglucosamine transporter [Achlya hypogyna]
MASFAHDAKVLTLVAVVLAACWVQGASLEGMLAIDSKAGTFISFFQFVSVAVTSLPSGPRLMPLHVHVGLATLYFAVSQMNSVALTCGVSFPLLNLFRSSTPAASLVVGYACFHKRYQHHQVVGVALISIGILLTTWMDQPLFGRVTFCSDASGILCSLARVQALVAAVGHWQVGVCLLVAALLLGSFLGHCQNAAMRAYPSEASGHATRESMFYMHVISLPLMLFSERSHVAARWAEWSAGDRVDLAPIQVGPVVVPYMFVLLLVNLVANYLCIRAVYHLAAQVSTVSLQVILTLRKACNLVFSVLYFAHAFTLGQWTGTCVVFVGVLIYSEVLGGGRPCKVKAK